VRRHVAGQARVGVLAPGTAQALGLLVDGVVVEAGLLQLDGREDAGHSRTDDEEAEVAASAGRAVVGGHAFRNGEAGRLFLEPGPSLRDGA
jgi:hypothetical protein